jgi:hypothetical protein
MLRGAVHESEMPSWASSAEGVQAFAQLLSRHVQEQVRAIVAALPQQRTNTRYAELALAYDRFVQSEFVPLMTEVGNTRFTGPWSSLPDKLRRAAQTHNQFVERFRGVGVEPTLPDSAAADPNAGSWKPWVLGGMIIAGLAVGGYLLTSVARAKGVFAREVAGAHVPELQSFRGSSRHALRSGTRRLSKPALRGYNLEVEPQHR